MTASNHFYKIISEHLCCPIRRASERDATCERIKTAGTAADCCLNMAAGILQLAVGPDREKAVLARLNDGFFAVVTLGMPAAKMAKVVREAMNDSRREFNISLSRRGSFTVAIASAEWGETASWDMMLSLAQQRL